MTLPRYSCPFIIHFPEIKTNRKPYRPMNTDYLDGIIPFIRGSYHIISKNSGMTKNGPKCQVTRLFPPSQL